MLDLLADKKFIISCQYLIMQLRQRNDILALLGDQEEKEGDQ
jgi:hypothetical protein